jgi:predicted GNAT family N-acyltransferase
MVVVRIIETTADMEKAFEIRRKVFVLEQEVDPAEEYDEYEISSAHFLAFYNGMPAGTCRIRKTEKGIKLERFAVLKEYRKKGIGGALVEASLQHEWILGTDNYVYMHAQEHAIDFYKKYGFKTEGSRFMECDIAHFTMSK